MSNSDSSLRLVQIVDHIAGHQYVIDIVNKVAHRITVPPLVENRVEGMITPPSILETAKRSFHQDVLVIDKVPDMQSLVITDNLGERIIDGIRTRGVRTNITYTSASSPEARYVVSTVAWISDERKIVVLSTRHDSKWGDSRARVVKASFDEPDPGLFRPPPDYKIVDQAGAFSIDIALPAPGRPRN